MVVNSDEITNEGDAGRVTAERRCTEVVSERRMLVLSLCAEPWT